VIFRYKFARVEPASASSQGIFLFFYIFIYTKSPLSLSGKREPKDERVIRTRGAKPKEKEKTAGEGRKSRLLAEPRTGCG